MATFSHHRLALCFFLPFALSLTLGKGWAEAPRQVVPVESAGPLYHEAVRHFTNMKTTVYEHKTKVDHETGYYQYDCVGFVSYALKKAAPEAWESVFKATGLAKGRIPSPPKYRDFFATLVEHPQKGWVPVGKVTDLRPGDVVAWEHRTETSSGHAVIIRRKPVPVPDSNGSWYVEIYDSTAAMHGDDSRKTDPRAQIRKETGRPGGLGHGIMVLLADPVSGVMTGLRWSPRAKAITVPIAAGRATS